MFLAAQSMAVGTLMVKWVTKYSDPIQATAWHMIFGGFPLLALSLAQETELPARLEGLTAADVGALGYTTVFGAAAGYAIFFYFASKGNLTKLSTLTFLTPLFAASFGFAVLGETLTPVQGAGALVTLLGITLVANGGIGEQPEPEKEA